MQARRLSWVLGATAAVFYAEVSLCAPGRPETPEGSTPEASVPVPLGNDPTSVARRAADVVLVGAAATSPKLSALIDELLRAADVVPQFHRVAGMDRTDLLDAAAHPSSGRARVWVTLAGPDQALLLFAGPSRERYLVRRVPLRSGLDELGRERIAQVIQSSTLALLRGRAGMTRAQMRVAVAQVGDAGKPDPATQKPAPGVSAESQGTRSRRSLAEPRLGLGYAAAWTGDALGVRHGPLASLGLDRIGGTPLTVALVLEGSFIQEYSTDDVGVRTQTSVVRLLLGGQWPLGGSLGFFGAIGGALDVTRVSPFASSERTVSLRSDQTCVVPAAHVQAGIEVEVGSFLLGTGPRVDLYPSDIHYDLMRGGRAERVVTVWPVVAGLSVQGAWRPWATKRERTQGLSIPRGPLPARPTLTCHDCSNPR